MRVAVYLLVHDLRWGRRTMLATHSNSAHCKACPQVRGAGVTRAGCQTGVSSLSDCPIVLHSVDRSRILLASGRIDPQPRTRRLERRVSSMPGARVFPSSVCTLAWVCTGVIAIFVGEATWFI